MTKYLGRRKATKDEKENGTDVVFMREDEHGNILEIHACKCYESWMQWGQDRDVLSDNVKNVEQWRRRLK